MNRPLRKTAATPASRLSRLLSGSALCGAAVFLALSAQAQTLPAVPAAADIKISAGGATPVITAPDANTLDIDLKATRTVINWASFHVGSADAVTFHFGQASDIVLNRSPTAVMVDAGGQVAGKVGAATGGNIWFYSPGGVVIAPGAVMTAGNFVFARGDTLVDMAFLDDSTPALSALRSASDALIRIDAVTSATSASINAAGELVLSASSGDLNATTALAAGGATISAAAGSVTVGEVTAGGLAAVSATGGSITLTALNGTAGASATATADVLVTNASASSAGGDIVITAGATASLGGGNAGRDIKVMGPAASLGSGSAGRDVFVTSTTGTAGVTGAVTAGDDIEVTATTGSVAADTATLTATGGGAADDAHVLAKSTSGSVTVGSAATQGTGATAGDVTLDAATAASLSSGASTQDIKVLGPSASLGSATAARDVLVTATTGTASVTGAVSAGDDIEVTATAGSVSAELASLTATGAGAADDAHVLARSTGGSVVVGSAATQGTGASLGDVTVEGATLASLASGNAAQDLKVLGPAATLGSGTAARDVFVTATTGAASVTGTVSAGDDVEITATTGSVTAGSASLTATGVGGSDDAHVLVKSVSGSVTVGSAASQGAGVTLGDVTLEGATAAALTSGAASRDLKVLAPEASLGSGSAGRDVFVTATTGAATVTGAVSAGDDIEVTTAAGSVIAASASLTSTGVGVGDDAHVLVRSTGGSVNLGAAATQGTGAAAGDVTIEGATSAALTTGASSRDLNVLGPAASLGSATVARDVFVTATTGAAAVTGTVSAGDDIEVTATSGSVAADGASLTSTGIGAADDAHVLARSASGSVGVGSATTQGTGAAAGDVTIEGATMAALASGAASRDIKVLAPIASLGSANAARDVLVTATTGSASVTGVVTAGDDIEVTATTGSVTAGAGSLTATGVGAADDAHVLVKSDSGAVTVGTARTQGTGAAAGDVTIDGATTASLTGTGDSSGDLVLRAGDSVLAGGSTIQAGRDLSVRAGTGSITLGTARAGDDIALSALTGSITASGDVEAGTTRTAGDPDLAGTADTLAGATLTGHDLDIRAQTVAVTGHVAAGRAPDGGETLGAAQQASDVIVTVSNADATPSEPALRLATGAGKAVTAHQDIILKAENTTGASISTGDVFAGRDVAIYSAAANITLRSALAGDDVVLRAPSGAIDVSGNLQAGRDSPGMTPTDATGAADDLNTALPLLDFDGNPGTVFKVVGFDVSIVSQSVRVGGSTIAGRQPSTDDPETPGPTDPTTSDVRIQTRLSLTPTSGLAPNIELGAVTATRDLQIDSAKAVTTGDLKAGRDIAVLGRGGVTPGAAPGDHSGSGVTIASAHAGDDALAFSVYGRTHILGGVTSGAPFQRLIPTSDRVIDGATEAADQLAIYLRYFDLDDASAPYVLKGGVIHLAGQGVTVGGALTAQGANADVRLRLSLDIDVTGATTAGGLAVFQTDPGGGSVKVGAVTAAGDVMLDGAGAEATGTLTSTTGDVAVRARGGGDVRLAGISAADDVVLRTTGHVSVTGPVSAGGGADVAGLGDALRTSDGSAALEGQTFDLTGADIDIVAGSVTTSGLLTASGAASDVRVQAAGAINLGNASAGRDVLVDGASGVSTGVLTAGRDVGVRSTGLGAGVSVGGASAGDDVVIRADGSITITGALSTGGGTDSAAADQAGDLMFGAAKSQFGGDLDLVGLMLDVRSNAGSIVATGSASSAGDARFQTAAGTGGSVQVGAVAAARDILLDGGLGAGPDGARASGSLTTVNGDVAVRARDGRTIRLAGVSAGDDVVLRTTGGVTLAGAISAGGGGDAAGLGDTLLSTEGAVTLEGQTFDLTGDDIDIQAGSVTATGSLTASGSASDMRVRSAGAISLANAAAGRDVLIDGAAAVTAGVLTAGRDVGIRSTGDGAAVSLGGASAGDDVVVRAKGSITVTGALSAGGGADSSDFDQAGDLMFGVATTNLGGDLDLAGRNIDVRSSAGSIVAMGLATSAGDARFQTAAGTGGSVQVAAVTAGRDVLLDGAGVETTGMLTATGRDIAVRARDGGEIRLAGASAADDVVLRTSGAVTITGTVSAGGGADAAGLGDLLASTAGAVSLEGQTFDLSGADIDIQAGSVAATGSLAASGSSSDVRVQSAGAISLANATADRDILVDGAAAVTAGVLAAGRDVGVRSTGDGAAVSLGGASAGDDVVLRAKGSITVSGALNAGGGADSSDTDQAGDLMFAAAKTNLAGDLDLAGRNIDVRSSAGSIVAMGLATSAGDARFQTAAGTGGSVKVAAVTAGRDILLDGGAGSGPNGAEATGALSATAGDIAVRARDAAAIRLAGATAGDDIVLRTSGALAASGGLGAGGGPDGAGLGDALRTAAGAVSLEGQGFDLTGGDIDIIAGSVSATGPLAAAGGSGDVRVRSTGAIGLGAVTAGRDVLIDGGAGVSAGPLSAGRDVGVRSMGDGAAVMLAGAAAGDDVVIRAKGAITVTGGLSAGGGSDSADPDQSGDLMFGVARSRLAGELDLAGRTVDVRSSAGSIQVGGASIAATDARFQTTGAAGTIAVGTVMAGRDVLLDGAGVQASGALAAADGDVAVRARDGRAINLVSVSAGDDVALRSTGGLVVSGVVSTLGRPSLRGAADRLTDAAESGALQIGGITFDLNGSDLDVSGGTVAIFKSNAFGSARIKAGAAALDGGASVGLDILVDSEDSLTVGDLSALGDIALRSRSGRLVVGRLTAGDDLVLRGALGISAVALKAGGGSERFGFGDQIFAADPVTLGQSLDLQGATIDLRAGGAITLGSAESAGDVRLQSTAGDVGVSGAVMAGRDLLADGATVTVTGALTAAGDIALYGRTGAVALASASAGDDIVVRAGGDVTASGELKAGQGAAVAGMGDRLASAAGTNTLFGAPASAEGGAIDIKGANIRLGAPLTASSVRLQSQGATRFGDAAVTGDIAVDAGDEVSTGVLIAGRDIALRSTGAGITIGSAAAGDDVVLRASRLITVSGPISASGGGDFGGAGDDLASADRLALGGEPGLVGQTIDIRSAGDVSAAGRMTAAGDVRIQATSGLITAANLAAGRDVLLDGASVQAGELAAGGDIAIRTSGGMLSLGSASAGDDVVLRSVGDIRIGGAVTANGGAERDGAGDRLFATAPLALGGAFGLSGSHIDLKSSSGSIEILGALMARDDVRVQAGGRVTTLREIAAGRDVLLDGGQIDAGLLRAGRDIAIRAQTGAVSLAGASAGDDLVLRASQDIRVTGALTAQGGADGEGAADRLFATDRSALAGDFDLAGANIDVRGRGGIALDGAASADRDARLQTLGEGVVSLAGVKAGGDVLADGRAVRASGQLLAGRDVAVRARAGSAELASASAGDDIAIRASGAVRTGGALASGSGANAQGAADRLVTAGEGGMIARLVDPLAATAVIEGFKLGGGDIDIRSGEAIALAGDAAAAGAASGVRLQAAGKVTTAGVTAGDAVFVRSADLSLGGPLRAMSARIEVTASGGVALGEGATAGSGALSLGSAQLARIEAPTLQIFAGDSSGAMRGAAVAIGALGVDTARIRTGLEIYAGGLAEVAITGAFAPLAGGANTTAVRIGAPNAAVGDWTPRSIKVVANTGGSIGAATTTGGRVFTDVRAFNVVELNAKGDILMGYQDFISRLAATQAASVPGVVKSLIAPQTLNGPRMLIVAGALTLRADGKVAQQDTGGLLGATPTGLYLLGTASGGPQLLLGRTSAGAPGLPEFIELNGALTTGGTVMTGQSVSLAAGIAFDKGVTPSGYYRLNNCAILQQSSCMASNGHPTISIPPDQLTGLTLEDQTAAAGTADPTVASATNEEVWKDSR